MSIVALTRVGHPTRRPLRLEGNPSAVTAPPSAATLWLGIHLPHLALEILLRGGSAEPDPLALHAGQSNRRVIYARSRAAARAGITPGMTVNAALALCGDLRLRVRDETAEAQTLAGIATWAGQFTSAISLRPPNGLLLEVGASLRLFGGIDALRRRIAEGLEALGYRVRIAVAPTPLAARLLARVGTTRPVTDTQTLQSVLRELPLPLLELPEKDLATLRGLGLRRLGDCLRLPRAGLAQRFGPGLVDTLDRAFGRRPDPQPPYTPPERFHSRIELPAEVSDHQALCVPLRRLLMELHGFLRGRGAGIQELRVELGHHAKPARQMHLGLVTPSRDPDHLQRLLGERLEHFELSAPVEAVGLHAENFIPLDTPSLDLFTPTRPGLLDGAQLVERLRARLGDGAVTYLGLIADHRPERAAGFRFGSPSPAREGVAKTPLQAPSPCQGEGWDGGSDGEINAIASFYPHPNPPPARGRERGTFCSSANARPLWLLEPPTPLEPVHERLALRTGPERIESGWWDGADVRRDYFVAEDPRHARLWIFREAAAPQRWFLHGLFG